MKKKASKSKTAGHPSFTYSLPTPQKGGIIVNGRMLGPDSNKTTIVREANSSTTMSSATWYTPELTSESWLLPKSRQEIIKWIRIFFNLEPYINSIITMHSRYPFSKFKLVHEDEAVAQFCQEALINDDFDMYEFILQASLSYQKFGEVICFGNWDKDNKRWKSFICLDPDLVSITQDIFKGDVKFEMVATNEIKRAIADKEKEGDMSEIPDVIIDAVRENKKIPLDSNGIMENDPEGRPYEPGKASIIARKQDPGAVRGTSVIQSLFKTLIYNDKIRMAQMAIADRHHMPIELWTVGHLTGDPNTSILPDENTLTEIRNMIEQAVQSPPFSIVYTPLLKYEALGVSGKLLSIYEDLGFIENQILVGLGVNKNLILGEGNSWGGNLKAIGLQRLIMEYQAIRDQFTSWMRRKVLLPMCIANGFKDEKTGKYKVPEIQWEKSLNYEQEVDERKLYFDFWKSGLISTKTLYSKMPAGLEYDQEMRTLELEVGTVFDKGDKRLPKKFKASTEVLPNSGGVPDVQENTEETPIPGGEGPEVSPETPGKEPGGAPEPVPAPATEGV